MTLREFPDGETYVRVHSACEGRTAVVLCALDRPDDKLLPLYFLSRTLREVGASQVILAAPYLAYMRQDRRFQPGEGVTARYFAEWVSTFVDGLVTVDPHLHRIHDLNEVYAVPNRVVRAADAVAAWIGREVERPVLIGPDSESWQWVSDVAARAKTPFTVLEKTRRGDRDVEVSVPELDRWRDHTPVLVDDIISTGRTMIETLGHLKRLGLPPAVCIGVHGVFAGKAFEEIRNAGTSSVVTCNTIPHESNAIDLTAPLGEAIGELLRESLGGR
jgi:ribose-phosphate pyrophosphokinase